jgi:hypothetical protein
MIRKGCTACYDLFFEFPQPSREGLEAVGRAYADAGVRAVLAPMVADRMLYQAYPGLMDAIPEPLRQQAEKIRLAPYEASADAAAAIFEDWPFERDRIRPRSRRPFPCIAATPPWCAAATWRATTGCPCRPTSPSRGPRRCSGCAGTAGA